jgi:polyphenol oxidase
MTSSIPPPATPVASSIPNAAASAQWHWQQHQGIDFLCCELLSPWVHGFFTQGSWPRKPGELTRAIAPKATAYQVKQVHGNRILITAEIEALPVPGAPALAPSLAEADGLLAKGANQAVWTCSADCTPALIGDVVTGQVAAVHAGWRGTAAQILPEAIAAFVAQGSRLADLRVALGPAIAGSVYQVDEATAAEVGATVVDGTEAGAILARLQALAEPPIWPDPLPGKVRLDVRRINLLQLTQRGLLPEQMAIAPHCTFQEPERFFSYRRTGEKKVQWSGIVSR